MVRRGRVALHLALAACLVLNLPTPAVGGSSSSLRFEDITVNTGINIRHHTRTYSGKNGDVLRMFTSGGAAVAVGDYDNDGYEDLFITDSEIGRPNHLFHNNGNLTFTDVAEQAGVAGGNEATAIVSDAIWFDYDNDGLPDLLVARFGTPILYHNEGHGKFRDVTAGSGLNKFSNTIAVIAFDYDNDGNLDLLFGNYFRPVNLLDLKDPHVLPNNLDGATNGGGVTLWHNTGHGTFEDATEKAGLRKVTGWTLDVGHGDFNNDGLQDIYLACDFGTDHMFLNNGDGTFHEVTAKATGWDTKKGMNVDVADYNNDGLLDIYVTNIYDDYMKECAMLWQNMGDGTFADVSSDVGVCDTGWGWAAKFGDFDNDGWLDLFVVNGLRSAGPENYLPVLLPMLTNPGIDFSDVNNWPDIGNRSWSGFQRKRFFHNRGDATFQEIGAAAGVNNDKDGRGIGVIDIDNDGRLDIVQTNANQAPIVYRNVSENIGNWVELKLIGTKSNRDGVGARVQLQAGGLTQIRELDGGNGYAGQSMHRIHFGIGTANKVDALRIRWPSGLVEQFNVPINAVTSLLEGSGSLK
jgi:hypothetical protein